MKKSIPLLKIIITEIYHILRPNFHQNEVLSELRKDGVVVLKSFLTRNDCKLLIQRFDDHVADSQKVDNDQRLFYAEERISEIKTIFSHPKLTYLKRKYIGRFNKSFWMMNRIAFREKSLGSGGGWHRDSALRRQLKFIVYLNDVDGKNGPFQYVIGSHTLSSKMITSKQQGVLLSERRFDDYQPDDATRLKSFHGPAGTLLVVDTSGLHRGTPLIAGERYAITEYISDFKINRTHG